MKKIIYMAILGGLLLQGCKTAPAPAAAAPAAPGKEAKVVEMNPDKIMQDSNGGNCYSCHTIPARPDVASGNIAPPFIGMKERFPDIAKLRAAIADQKVFAPDTIMPPFGRNHILTPEQIDVIAQYIYQY